MTGQALYRSLLVGEFHIKALAYQVAVTHTSGGAHCGFTESELEKGHLFKRHKLLF